jgi:hypothetical protein
MLSASGRFRFLEKNRKWASRDFSQWTQETFAMVDGRDTDDWDENCASREHGTSSTAAYPSMASVAGGSRRWQPGAIGRPSMLALAPQAYANSSSKVLACFKSNVSKPSVNQP